MSGRLFVGIDPGVHTGYAEAVGGQIMRCESMRIDEALERVRKLAAETKLLTVVFEDARMRTGYFGKDSKAKQQGAGSIKRDCKIWADFLADLGIAYMNVSPRQKGAKRTSQAFAALTGFRGLTNEHGRDAAMLVWGRK